MRAVSREIPQPLTTKFSLKITDLKFTLNLPGANELIQTINLVLKQTWTKRLTFCRIFKWIFISGNGLLRDRQEAITWINDPWVLIWAVLYLCHYCVIWDHVQISLLHFVELWMYWIFLIDVLFYFFTAPQTFSPSKFHKRRQKPLGNLQSFTKLVSVTSSALYDLSIVSTDGKVRMCGVIGCFSLLLRFDFGIMTIISL